MKVSTLSFGVLLLAGSLSAAVPEDLEESFGGLKEAVTKKDAAQVKKLAAETCALAREAISSKAPESAEEKENWTKQVARAKEIELYSEYSLFALAVQSPAATTIDLIESLEKQNPKSKYLEDAYASYFYALSQTGKTAQIVPSAEKAIVHLPNNEDVLLVLADSTIAKGQNDRAAAYAERLLVVLRGHPKPDSLEAAAWERKRAASMGRAHWIAGVVHAQRHQFYEADKDLRAALPLIRGNDAMTATAQFNLCIANYQLGKAVLSRKQVLEAAGFCDQAAATKGFAQAREASNNSYIMKREAVSLR